METLYKLNDRVIKNATPKEKDYRLSDGGGLYLVVKSSGGKPWRWSYEFNGKEKLLSYGPYPFVTLANARVLHAAARALKSNGTDPAAEKQAKKHAEEEREKASSMPTFAELTKEWFPLSVWAGSQFAGKIHSRLHSFFPSLTQSHLQLGSRKENFVSHSTTTHVFNAAKTLLGAGYRPLLPPNIVECCQCRNDLIRGNLTPTEEPMLRDRRCLPSSNILCRDHI